MIDKACLETPIGWLLLSASYSGIKKVEFVKEAPQALKKTKNTHLLQAVRQLKEYFAGKRQTFDLKISPEGTDFQLKVWKKLSTIPYGETLSYIDLAKAVRCPKGARAVGNANNKNPVGIIVPCHRVIGKNGKLVGYGGGLSKKAWLLEHERGN